MKKQEYPAWISLNGYIAERMVEAIDCWLPQINSHHIDFTLEEWEATL